MTIRRDASRFLSRAFFIGALAMYAACHENGGVIIYPPGAPTRTPTPTGQTPVPTVTPRVPTATPTPSGPSPAEAFFRIQGDITALPWGNGPGKIGDSGRAFTMEWCDGDDCAALVGTVRGSESVVCSKFPCGNALGLEIELMPNPKREYQTYLKHKNEDPKVVQALYCGSGMNYHNRLPWAVGKDMHLVAKDDVVEFSTGIGQPYKMKLKVLGSFGIRSILPGCGGRPCRKEFGVVRAIIQPMSTAMLMDARPQKDPFDLMAVSKQRFKTARSGAESGSQPVSLEVVSFRRESPLKGSLTECCNGEPVPEGAECVLR